MLLVQSPYLAPLGESKSRPPNSSSRSLDLLARILLEIRTAQASSGDRVLSYDPSVGVAVAARNILILAVICGLTPELTLFLGIEPEITNLHYRPFKALVVGSSPTQPILFRSNHPAGHHFPTASQSLHP
jgi:hypothetical protein